MRISIILLCVCLVQTAFVFAQPVNEVVQRQLTTQTNPLERANKASVQPSKKVVIEKKEEKKVVAEGIQFLVKKIVIEGNGLFKSDDLLAEAHQLEGTMMSLADLQKFADRITILYHKHGYTTSRAYIPPQKVVDGVVSIHILEVRVGKVSVEGERWFSKSLYRNALGLNSGDHFEMGDLENALRKINTQPDRFATTYLAPGHEPGTTDILMKVQDQQPLHASLEYNLTGSKLTGGDRYLLHLTDNNLTGHGDSLKSTFSMAEAGALYASSMHYEMPIPKTRDVFHLDVGRAQSRLQKNLYDLHVTGNLISFISGWTHTFVEDTRVRLEGDVRFEIKDSKTDVLKDKFSFDRNRVLVAGPRVTFNDATGRTFAGADVHTGAAGFMGSSSHHDSLASRMDSGGSFVYETLNLARIQRLPLGMALISQASGQFSDAALNSLEQFNLGGMYSVRGYPENDASGDSGFSVSQEWRIPVYFIPETWHVVGMKDKTWRDALSLATFIDAGRVFNRKREQVSSLKDTTLVGAGIGLRFYLSPDSNITFDTGFPLGDDPSDNHAAQFHLAVRWGF